MARAQSQGGNRGTKGPAEKPEVKAGTESKAHDGPKAPASKVGSDPEAAGDIGGKGDFGVKESDTRGRAYTSANTRASDPGAAQPHAGEDEGRVSGVGGNASGVGASSGGDLDADFVGVGTGGGIAQTGPDDDMGAVESTGTARDFASGPPTKNRKGPKAGKIEGSTVDHSGGDVESTAEGRGADAASRSDPDRLDDSFVGEVSTGEASGQDSH